MEFSFGIITDFKNESKLLNLITSIKNQNINNYQIILVGSVQNITNHAIYARNKNIDILDFDESKKEGWITKKKNLITDNSIYENIVYLHDYLLLEENWYSGFRKFGNNFDICLNKIYNFDGSRYRDWCLSPHNMKKIDKKLNLNLEYLLPYNETSFTNYMYVSGAYWVAKKTLMKRYPLNEDLTWGEGEDIEWSHRVRRKSDLKFNKFSSVKLQKEKEVIFTEISNTNLTIFKKIEMNIFLRVFDNATAFFKRFLYSFIKKIKYFKKKYLKFKN